MVRGHDMHKAKEFIRSEQIRLQLGMLTPEEKAKAEKVKPKPKEEPPLLIDLPD